MASAARDKKEKKVITIHSKADFEKLISEAGNKHILVEFFATWCGPCALIGPRLEEFAHEYEDCLLVVKVDVDDNEELAEEYDISSMPSFLIIKNKVTLEQFVGNNGEKVQSTLQKFCGKPDESKLNKPGPSPNNTDKSSNRIVSMLKSISPTKLMGKPSGKNDEVTTTEKK